MSRSLDEQCWRSSVLRTWNPAVSAVTSQQLPANLYVVVLYLYVCYRGKSNVLMLCLGFFIWGSLERAAHLLMQARKTPWPRCSSLLAYLGVSKNQVVRVPQSRPRIVRLLLGTGPPVFRTAIWGVHGMRLLFWCPGLHRDLPMYELLIFGFWMSFI